MKLWHLFFGYPARSELETRDETATLFGTRERDVAEAPSVAAIPIADGHAAQLDSAGSEKGEARATARVYLIRSPRVRLYDLAIYFKSRGYRLKQDGRGYIEAIR